MARREEWKQQVRLAALLNRWLDPCTFCAFDSVAASVASGAMRKKRGVKSGVPDVLVWYRGKFITIELKSRRGQCSPSQRLAREALLRAGAQWWECRSANAAMWALQKSGVPLRMIAHRYGIQCWRQPALAPWEVPRRDPAEPRPSAPEVAARRRTAQRRWRERQRACKAAKLAAECDNAAGADIAA